MFDKEAHTLSDAQIAKIIEYAPVIEKFLKNVKAEVVMRAKRGQTVEGVKVVDGRASYDWSIPEDKLLKVFKKLGVPKECWHEHEVLSPNKLKNLMKTNVIQKAWHEERRPILHGWVYGMNDGLLNIVGQD
ncbi:MAG: DUF2800 domain-containing protein, partial [Micrococcales bacterium]|nr:DUF2800 domain-containing protein [Micrococcales bacterium]